MSENSSSSSSGTSPTSFLLGAASLGAGAYHGYCDAQGIAFEKENLEWALTYGPTIGRGVIAGVTGGLVGFIGGGAVGATALRGGSGLGGTAAKAAAGSAVGAVGIAGLAGTFGAIAGAFQTVVGYGAGYLAGWALK